jgi:hypothetical protein
MIRNYSKFKKIFEDVDALGGKSIFSSFLKSITALGLKSMNKVDDKQFLFLFKTNNVQVDLLKSVFYRFRSLAMFASQIEKITNCSLYYGIKSDLSFEYGFFTDKNLPIGKFKLNKSTLQWLKLSKSPSSDILKKNIISLDMNEIILFCKINNSISEYNLKSEKFSGPSIIDDVITYGYYGIGKWDSSNLDQTEYDNLKSNFKAWLSRYKWSDKVLLNVSYNSYWVYFNIKIKR